MRGEERHPVASTGARVVITQRDPGGGVLSVAPVGGSMTDADGIRIRYSPGSDDVGDALRAESFEQFLRRSKEGRVAVGDEWEVNVNDGCGRTKDVTLSVEAVNGGTTLGNGTRFEFRADAEE